MSQLSKKLLIHTKNVWSFERYRTRGQEEEVLRARKKGRERIRRVNQDVEGRGLRKRKKGRKEGRKIEV